MVKKLVEHLLRRSRSLACSLARTPHYELICKNPRSDIRVMADDEHSFFLGGEEKFWVIDAVIKGQYDWDVMLIRASWMFLWKNCYERCSSGFFKNFGVDIYMLLGDLSLCLWDTLQILYIRILLGIFLHSSSLQVFYNKLQNNSRKTFSSLV